MEDNISAMDDISVAAEEPVVVAESTVSEEAIPQKKKRKPINQQKLQDNLWGWLFCVPLIIGTILFVYIAFVIALMLSFTNYNTGSGALWEYLGKMFSGDQSVFNMTQFGGEANDPFYWYKFAFTENEWSGSLWQQTIGQVQVPKYDSNGNFLEYVMMDSKMNAMGATLFNTVFYMIGIPIGMVLSMFFAVCMSRDIKGGNIFRVLYYIPCVASTIAIVYTFNILFKTNGVINQLFGSDLPWMGVDSSGLITEHKWNDSIDTYWSQGMLSKFMIVIMSVWKGLGGTIILYVAGLSGVNAATKEAAQIDGANAWTIFWRVTMPDLYPVIFYNVVTSVIGGMQIYAEPELLFSSDALGHPNLMTSGFVGLIWHYGMNLTTSRPSQGAAYGMILAIIIFALTLFQFWVDGRKNKA